MNRRGDLKQVQVRALRGGTTGFGALQAIGKIEQSKETRTKQQGGWAEKSTQSSARGERVHHIASYWQKDRERG